MANVALIAPLLGPLAGAALIHVAPWQSMFVLFAALAASPSTACGKRCRKPPRCRARRSPPPTCGATTAVLGNRRFLCGALAIGFASLPLLAGSPSRR